MLTFRSPKHVTGPDLGVPPLTPQAYYRARYGDVAWDALEKYPRETWQDYLDWYRTVLNLPVRHNTTVTRVEPLEIEPENHLLRVHMRDCNGPTNMLARKVVLATGIKGNGDWRLSDLDMSCLAQASFAHTNWEFDVAAHRGHRVAILGAGASAFDTAATLLEAGAASVTQFVRRTEIPKVNPLRWMEKAGFLRHFAELDDLARWRWVQTLFLRTTPPTQDGVNRCASFSNYRLRTGTTWSAVSMEGDEVLLTASDGTIGRYDFLVLGTGYTVDVRLQPELAAFAEHIALWQDRFTPPPGEENSVVARFPYLNRDLSFQEREPGTAPFLANIFNFTYTATASIGYSGSSLTGMKYGIQRVISGLVRDLWLTEAPRSLAAVQAYKDIDLDLTPLAGLIE